MPNGGTDCCGTCFFNSKNGGLTGFGPTSDKKGKSICVIRKIEIPNPYWTYCPNHNGHNRDKIKVPIGPVTTHGRDNSDKEIRKVWLDPPDSEIIRETLLIELDNTSITRNVLFPSPTHFEHQVIRHLAFLKEKCALPRLYELTQTSFGDHRYPPTLMTEWVSDLIGYAVEALLEISEGNNYLEKVQYLIDFGITENYSPENDPYQSIRYYLIRGLEYCAQPLADTMLRKGLLDPQKSIRKAASEVLENRAVPTIKATETSYLMNQEGAITGGVTRFPDGRHLFIAGKKPDEHAMIIISFIMFASTIPRSDQIVFSSWAGLPEKAWSQNHREAFAMTLYNYFLEIREQDNDLPPEIMNAVNMLLEKGAVPSLAKELTPEVKEVFKKMFVL